MHNNLDDHVTNSALSLSRARMLSKSIPAHLPTQGLGRMQRFFGGVKPLELDIF